MAQAPITTIVPFGNTNVLPSCAVNCGHLYDANGACVPPAVPTNQPAIYTQCFCADPRLAPFSTTTGGVCDTACTADPKGLASITNWYHSICSITSKPAVATATVSTTGGTSSSTGINVPAPQQTGPPGDWISTHYQWVIMLVVLVVGIAGIWIGACIWRRRYLRKRDLQKQAAGNTDSWGPALGSESVSGIPMTYNGKGAGSAAVLPTFTSQAEKRKSKGGFFSRS